MFNAVERERERETYENLFYHEYYSKKHQGDRIYGFPIIKGPWCIRLKVDAIKERIKPSGDGKVVQYLGIAADEPERIKRHTKEGIILPLVLAGWNESFCRDWCEENDLLSPIYTTATRGGCWFCHNQGVCQLRLLRKNYPELWNLLLKWDVDSPITFNPRGLTVHDFDKRFQYEDEGKIPTDRKFRWKMLDEIDSNKIQD